MRIIPSARDRGISDEDMQHALRVPRRVIDLDEETTLYTGAGLTGALLAVVVTDLETEAPPDHSRHGSAREVPPLPLTYRHNRLAPQGDDTNGED